MPLSEKGEKIKRAMVEEYGAKKGEEVFYASVNAGKIKGADQAPMATAPNSGIPMGGYRPASDGSFSASDYRKSR